MKVLVLSPYPQKIVQTLKKYGDKTIIYEEKINPKFIHSNNIESIVSYGYRYLITPECINRVNGFCINLHMSYLPYNKGAHPNLWSHAEETPSGVTIHMIDKGLDTGNILFQKQVLINDLIHTFSTSYKLLTEEIEDLFDLNWRYLRTMECKGWKQQTGGTFHYAKESASLISCLPNGWDTNIKDFKKKYKQIREQSYT